MTALDLSVVICTLGRPVDLRRALTAFAEQHAEVASGYEIVIVENGPATAVTAELVAEFEQQIPVLRVHEPRLGLSQARNAGLEAAGAPVVVFIDDDATPTAPFVDAHVAAYRDPLVVAAGGPIHVVWLTVEPTWLTDHTARFFGHLDLGREPQDFAGGELPYGGNLSVRRDAALAAGGFDPMLGRTGGNLISCEETAFLHEMKQAGRLAYLPDALVHHYVNADRANRRWLLRRWHAQGQSEVLLARVTGMPLARPRDDVGAALRGIARATARAAVRRGAALDVAETSAFYSGRLRRR